MVKKGEIGQYRDRLDSTLASPDLTDDNKLESLVKDQILKRSDDKNNGYIDNVTKKRKAQVSNFLEMLRSASENHDASPRQAQHGSWKLKQDTEELRVMYREGPAGSPIHTLLVEGYVDAPLDVCMCVSWEASLYPRWFPETVIPYCKVARAKTLRKVRIGEDISLVRMKLSWPLSTREALLHYFEFDYFRDDLVIAVMNTIPDVENVQMETHGFTNEEIPDAENTVRVDLIGGFALQKVTENKTYFRVIANLDVKLDFVPPSLINFISRQLIGSGFRLYQKVVASTAKGDEHYSKALDDPLYRCIRDGLLSKSEPECNLETEINQNKTLDDKNNGPDVQNSSRKGDVKVLANGHANRSSQEHSPESNEIEEEEIKEMRDTELETVSELMLTHEDQKVLGTRHVELHPPNYNQATEIEEELLESNNVLENGKENPTNDKKEGSTSTDQLRLKTIHKKVQLSPQVEQALGTLDKILSVIREGKLKAQGEDNSTEVEVEEGKERRSSVDKHVKWEDIVRTSRSGNTVDDLRAADSETQVSQGSPGVSSPAQNPSVTKWSRNSPSAGSTPTEASPLNIQANGTPENKLTGTKKTGQPKRWRLCCLHLISQTQRLVT